MQSSIDISALLKTALAEDIGTGDITGNATIPADMQARFAMNARAELVVCGLTFLPELFAMIDPSVQVEILVAEGEQVAAGTTLARLWGPARALLAGERTALNLVQQLSGVATLTRQYVDAVAGTGATILDTRKTIPGLRAAQKYAVRCGGGKNHRMGLYDAVLIKDNHIAVAGGVAAAVGAARMYLASYSGEVGAAGTPLPIGERMGEGLPESMLSPDNIDFVSAPILTFPREGKELPESLHRRSAHPTIEVECDTLTQLDEALTAGADIVLLDNMDNAALVDAVARVRAHNAAHGATVKTEASGNVSLTTVRAIAQTGVDYISVGKLTHSAVAVDVGLDAG